MNELLQEEYEPPLEQDLSSNELVLTTNSIKTTNTIDGLSGQTITSMYHSTVFNKTIIAAK